MNRFLDTHEIGQLTKEQLVKLQESTVEKLGVIHVNTLYNPEANAVYSIFEAPNKEVIENHHAKLGYKCDWITEVKTTA